MEFMDTSEGFELSYINFNVNNYDFQLQQKIAATFELLRREIVVALPEGSELPEMKIFPSQPAHFRSRCRLSIMNDEFHDVLEYFVWDCGKPASYIDSYPIASLHICCVMPMLLKHIRSIGGILRQHIRGVSFLSTTVGDVLINLIYERSLLEHVEEWRMQASRLQAALAEEVELYNQDPHRRATFGTISVIGRSKNVRVCIGSDCVTEKFTLDDGRQLIYRQPEGAFSNPNPSVSIQALNWLANIMRSLTASGPINLLELYCGGGNHTICLAPVVNRIVAVELSSALCLVARENLQLNHLNNVEVHQVHSHKFAHAMLRNHHQNGSDCTNSDAVLRISNFNCILVDPPRAGLDAITRRLVGEFDNILYISCNPIALARDLKDIVSRRAYRIESLALMDQFAYSPHVEVGVHLKIT